MTSAPPAEPRTKSERRVFRESVRTGLATLPFEAVRRIAQILYDELPETRDYLDKYSDPDPEAADKIDVSEEALWPRILQRQAQAALSSDTKTALAAATFFAKLYKKIDTGVGLKPKAPEERKLEPHERVREAQETLRQLAEQFASHEPGEAVAIDDGIKRK